MSDLTRKDLSSPDSAVFIDFEEYLEILKKFSPDALTRSCPASSAKNLNEIMKLQRSTLRRIFLKFLSTQTEYGAKVDEEDAGKINLQVLLEFIQSGRIHSVQKSAQQPKK
jgi:hypothetical protein